MSGDAWVSLQRRAAACSAIVLRTDPADGRVRYLCSWADKVVFHTFWDLGQLSIYLEGVEQKNAEREEHMRLSSTRRMTPEELHVQSLQSQIGGLGAAIYQHSIQLAGVRPIGRISLLVAQAEGRNHLQDLEAKRVAAIRERLRIANELAKLGKRPARYAEYLAAAQALDTGGPADGH